MHLPVSLGHTAGGTRAGKADEVFRADVRGKDGGTDGKPCGAASVQEVVAGGLFLLLRDIPANPYHRNEEDSDENPVQRREADAVEVLGSGCRSSL